ncbi:MAG: DNA alkylation repair protein [Coriobacteriia bacterium]
MPSPAPATTPATLCARVLAELSARANPDNVAGMARFGISPTDTLGVSMPNVRSLAKDARRQLGRDPHACHELAELLWASSLHEARIAASLVDSPALVDDAQMECWAADLDSWDVCDQLCINLFRKAPGAWDKALQWPGRAEEFVKRAGFVLGATLAVHEKAADDARFMPLLALAERECADERNFVKKAINWQIRQIGKRSATLNAEAIAVCERILVERPESASARWVARGALRELLSEQIRERLGLGPGGYANRARISAWTLTSHRIESAPMLICIVTSARSRRFRSTS